MRWTGNDTRYTLEMSGLVVVTTALLALVNWPPAEGQSVKQSRVVESRVVEASRIVFKDERGRVRGVIGMAKEGGCGFTFKDATGTERAHLDVTDAGDAIFGLRRKGGGEAVRIAVAADGSAGVVLAAPDGEEASSAWTMDSSGKLTERP
jgi:hypothetical protein